MTTPEKTPASTGPPKKETPSWPTALHGAKTNSGYHPAPAFQAELERRVGDVAAIRDLLPRVFGITLVQATAEFAKKGGKR